MVNKEDEEERRQQELFKQFAKFDTTMWRRIWRDLPQEVRDRLEAETKDVPVRF